MKKLALTALLAVCTSAFGVAQAQSSYPEKPIKMMVGFSAGGGSDLVARVLAETLSKKLGQPVVVENKPGAGGVLATRTVAREKPDGYTLILGSAAAFVINPFLMDDIGYDPNKDFTPVGSVARFNYTLMGRDDLPVSNLEELIAYAKQNPGKLNIGSAGVGSNTHLVALNLMNKAGIELTHVPYKGTAGALTDLQGRNIDLLFDSVPTVRGVVAAGKVKPFGTTGTAREEVFQNMPTLSEAGVPGFSASNWFAVFAPKDLNPKIADQLNVAINEALNDPELLKRFESIGNQPLRGSRQDLENLVKTESASYKKMIDEAGLKGAQK